MERREHRRAKLSLPVRLRWANPFGQKTEICETLDVSRGGLLVPCHEAHDPGVALWVTFPYDASPGDGQPEVFAKVVHAAEKKNGAPAGLIQKTHQKLAARNGCTAAIGLRFAAAGHADGGATDGNANVRDSRGSVRHALAVPIRVRPKYVPWFEEAMTIDVSPGGLSFLSSREYDAGEELLISFEPAGAFSGSGATEFRAEVVRVAPAAVSPSLAIAVRRLP